MMGLKLKGKQDNVKCVKTEEIRNVVEGFMLYGMQGNVKYMKIEE